MLLVVVVIIMGLAIGTTTIMIISAIPNCNPQDGKYSTAVGTYYSPG
jgi:hypothetical protein